MKTAISLPNPLFRKADRLAKLLGKTRSKLYQEAVQEYVARHARDADIEAINKVVREVGQEVDPFVQRAADRILRSVEWEE